MSKTFYSDFVAHITRFYFSWDKSREFNSEADQKNYEAVASVISSFNVVDTETLRVVYSGHKPSSALRRDNVVYSMLSRYEKLVAVERGLIAKRGEIA